MPGRDVVSLLRALAVPPEQQEAWRKAAQPILSAAGDGPVRPAHVDKALEAALSAGAVPTEIGYIKKVGDALLAAERAQRRVAALGAAPVAPWGVAPPPRPTHSRRAVVLAVCLVSAAALVGGPIVLTKKRPSSSSPTLPLSAVEREEPLPPPLAPAPSGLTLPIEVRTQYERAKQAVRAGDFETARDGLEEAVRLLPEFTEGWYNLGATLTHLAVRAASRGADAEAVELFRQAVDSKKTSRDLMGQQRWYIYKSRQEQEQVRSDVEAGLADADEVLGDERSLLAALRLWAAMGR